VSALVSGPYNNIRLDDSRCILTHLWLPLIENAGHERCQNVTCSPAYHTLL